MFAYDFLKRGAHQVGKRAIDGAYFSFERHGDQNIVERIDEIAITLLRSADPVKKLVDLFFAGRHSIALLDSLDQATQLRNFLRTLPYMRAEKGHQQHQSDGQSFEAMCKRPQRAPGNKREHGG